MERDVKSIYAAIIAFAILCGAIGTYEALTARVAHAQQANGLAYVPLGYQQITATSSAFSLTVPAGATMALIESEAQNIRWRDDGTDPTTGVGMLLSTSAPVPLRYSGTLTKWRGIAATSGAILNVSYYR